MKFLDADFVKGFMKMANDGWLLGFHERNGGNLSYRVKDEEVESVRENFVEREWRSIGCAVPNLAGQYFLFTGSGKFFSNVLLDPEDTICMIEIDASGENYRIVWGLINGGVPTSELPSHLMNHETKMLVTNGANRVIYHAHPVNICALTYILPLKDEIFTRELWEMNNECCFIFPEGVGVVPWMIAGSVEIGIATRELMKTYNVAIWAHHGMFVAGPDFDTAFGLFHTIEKTADILVKVKSMSPVRAQTITADNFRTLMKSCNLDLPERFLFEK